MKRFAFILSFFCLVFFTSCTFLYIPPVLESQNLTETLNIEASRGLFLAQDRLILSLTPRHITEEGWLMVQWFSESRELASDAKWLDASQEGFHLSYSLPHQLALEPGTWRAVVSWQGRLLRQFSIDIARKNQTL